MYLICRSGCTIRSIYTYSALPYHLRAFCEREITPQNQIPWDLAPQRERISSAGVEITSRVAIYLQLWIFCSHLLTTINIFTSLPNLCHYLSFSYSKTLPHEKTAAFGYDICNTYGYKCTQTNTGILFLKIMIKGIRDKS